MNFAHFESAWAGILYFFLRAEFPFFNKGCWWLHGVTGFLGLMHEAL